MRDFFLAQSVAVVGVSSSQGNMGRAMVHNLLEFRFQGVIYLVGPKGGAFLGHRIHTRIADIPEPVDLATILIPAAAVPAALQACGEKGIRRIVLQSAGFSELGDERRTLEMEIGSILHHYQMRLIGPNCIGIINRHSGLAVPFMPFRAEAPPGRVAIVSQSGGVGAMMLNGLATEHLGFSKFASIGNKLNVDENDFLEYLIEDDVTDAVFCYLEGIANGRRLMEIAGRAAKPIVLLKSNRGAAGEVIARSHSASLTADDAVVSAAARQCGMKRVYEQHEAIECLKAFTLPKMGGGRLAIISRSGGHAVLAADAADELGFALPSFPEETLRLVRERSRAGVIALHNPMDLGDLFDLELYCDLADTTLARSDIDGLLFIHNYQGIVDTEASRKLILDLGALMARAQKPVAVCVFTTGGELAHNRSAARYPIFTDPREALRALATNRDDPGIRRFPFAQRRPAGIALEAAGRELGGAPPGWLSPAVGASLLSAYGIPVVPWRQVNDWQEADHAARELGYPVAMKTANPALLHKSDAGAVALHLADEDALQDAYVRLKAIGGPSVLLEPMATEGLEWFVGGRQDGHFGAVVVVGLGGIYVEIFREPALRIAPIERQEASALIDDCRGAALLRGVRGEPARDREALAELIERTSWLLADFPEIGELDLNPVRVYPSGSGVCALDWRMLKTAIPAGPLATAGQAAARYPRKGFREGLS